MYIKQPYRAPLGKIYNKIRAVRYVRNNYSRATWHTKTANDETDDRIIYYRRNATLRISPILLYIYIYTTRIDYLCCMCI